MSLNSLVLSTIILASQLFLVRGVCTPTAAKSLATFLSGAPNAVTACNEYNFTKIQLTELNGKYYVQKSTKFASRCGTFTFQTLISNNVGLNTYKKYIDPEWIENDYLYVALENGQLRNTRFPELFDFGTVNIVYFNCKIGVVFIACAWNDNAVLPYAVVVLTKERNPSAEDMQILMAEAEKAKIPTADLVDADHSNCPCEPPEDIFLKALNLSIQIIKELITN